MNNAQRYTNTSHPHMHPYTPPRAHTHTHTAHMTYHTKHSTHLTTYILKCISKNVIEKKKVKYSDLLVFKEVQLEENMKLTTLSKILPCVESMDSGIKLAALSVSSTDDLQGDSGQVS